jgi:hypothetical protein
MNSYTPYYGLYKGESYKHHIKYTVEELILDENTYPILIKFSHIESNSILNYKIVFSNGLFGLIEGAQAAEPKNFYFKILTRPEYFFFNQSNEKYDKLKSNWYSSDIDNVKYEVIRVFFNSPNISLKKYIRDRERGIKDYLEDGGIDKNWIKRINKILFYFKLPRLPDQIIDIIKYFLGTDDDDKFSLLELHDYVKKTDKLIMKEEIIDEKLIEKNFSIEYKINKSPKQKTLEKIIHEKIHTFKNAIIISKDDNKDENFIYFKVNLTSNLYDFYELTDFLETIQVFILSQEII